MNRPPLSRPAISMVLAATAFIVGFSTSLAKYYYARISTATVPLHPPSIEGGDAARSLAMDTIDTEAQAEALKGAVISLGERPESEARYDEILKLLMRWAALDPQGTLEFTRHHYDPRHRNAFLSSVLGSWAAKDGRAALDWTARNLPHDYTQYDAVLDMVGKKDPAAAWSYAKELAAKEDSASAQSIYVSALRGILYTGKYEEAASLIETLQADPGHDKYDLSAVVAGEWGRYDPVKAAQWVAALPTDNGLNRRQALVSLGTSWAQSDPQAVADFAIELPPGIAKQNMLATSLDSWATDHPDEAAQWLNRNQADPDLDLVVRSVASSPKMIDSDPDAALTWANTIDNEAVRLQTLTMIMNRWMTNDPASAQHYLNNSKDLSADMLGNLKQNLDAMR